jgi:hypothetical protein
MMDGGAKSNPTAIPDRWRWRWANFKAHLWGWLLEDQFSKGLGGPPNNWRSSGDIAIAESSTCVHVKGATFLNDGHWIGIYSRFTENGQSDERWNIQMPTETFRRMALWYLWRWAVGEWFGLRRWLYFRRLSQRVRKWKRANS